MVLEMQYFLYKQDRRLDKREKGAGTVIRLRPYANEIQRKTFEKENKTGASKICEKHEVV